MQRHIHIRMQRHIHIRIDDTLQSRYVSAPPPKRVRRSPSAASEVVNFLQDYVERQDVKEQERAKKQEEMHDQKMSVYKGML
jgi:hypothetical protein